MQRRKIIVACLSVLLVGLALPTATVPRAHAFHSSITVTLAGLGVHGFQDPLTLNTVDGISGGSTLNVNIVVLASGTVFQRNVTIGFKGDWMTAYQNATGANPTSTLALNANAQASVTIAVTIPSTTGTVPHTWSVAVWDGASNSLNAASCPSANDSETFPIQARCIVVNYNNAGFNRLAIYSGDQLSGAQASVQASSVLANVQTALNLLQSHPTTPGITAASGQYAQARTEQSLGNQAWQNGDYSGAKGHFQNALNDANAAAASLTNQGGGVDNATLINLLLGGTGIALIGVGALLAGIGALFYLRRKPKA